MITRLLSSKTKTVTFAAVLLAISALLSRLLGLFRDNLLANLFSKQQTDIYFAAFRIPDFVYGILITGGIVAAFLPIFSEYFKKRQGQVLTNNVLTFFLLFLALLCSLLAIFTPQLIRFIVPGFSSQQKTLVVSLTRIMFLSPILLGISAVFSGILQYFNLFFAVALAPIFYNLGIIVGILWLTPLFGLKGLAWGVGLGAFFHLILHLLPAIKTGFKFRPSFNFKHPGLQRIFRLMIPRIVGAASFQINLIVITAIASTLIPGSLTVFNFANNLQGVPIGLIGISFATATFPSLARTFAQRKEKIFLKKFSDVFSRILFLIIPLSFLVFLLREGIVRIVLGSAILADGKFTWWETQLTSGALGIFAMALFAHSLIPLLTRTFFSQQDTKTPVKIAVSAMALNVFLSLYLVGVLKDSVWFQSSLAGFLQLSQAENIAVLGLPLALSLSSLWQFFLLFFLLKKRFPGKLNLGLTEEFKKTILAALVMAMVVFGWLKISSALLLNLETFLGIFSQTLLAVLGGLAFYLFCSLLLKSKEPRIIWLEIRKQFSKGKEVEKPREIL